MGKWSSALNYCFWGSSIDQVLDTPHAIEMVWKQKKLLTQLVPRKRDSSSNWWNLRWDSASMHQHGGQYSCWERHYTIWSYEWMSYQKESRELVGTILASLDFAQAQHNTYISSSISSKSQACCNPFNSPWRLLPISIFSLKRLGPPMSLLKALASMKMKSSNMPLPLMSNQPLCLSLIFASIKNAQGESFILSPLPLLSGKIWY